LLTNVLTQQVYKYYYKPYVQEVTLDDGTKVWKMLPSLYCETVKLAIKPDGTISDDVMKLSGTLAKRLAKSCHSSTY
jgi:hypothetical protein